MVFIGDGGCVCSILLFCRFVTMVVCICVRLVCMCCSVMVHGFVLMFFAYPVLLNVDCFLSLGVGLCIVSLCSACDICFAFCLSCDACCLMCS